MNEAALAAVAGATIILLFLLVRWKWRSYKEEAAFQYTPTQLVHRLCPHNNVVQGIEVEQKDSLDEHLDVLTRKLADKEGRLRLSKYKIRETQNEIENLHALDNDVQQKYRQIMDLLRQDLLNNEKECKKIQEQIEWVSRRRAELNSEVKDFIVHEPIPEPVSEPIPEQISDPEPNDPELLKEIFERRESTRRRSDIPPSDR